MEVIEEQPRLHPVCLHTWGGDIWVKAWGHGKISKVSTEEVIFSSRKAFLGLPVSH